jgi:hypothetical protein
MQIPCLLIAMRVGGRAVGRVLAAACCEIDAPAELLQLDVHLTIVCCCCLVQQHPDLVCLGQACCLQGLETDPITGYVVARPSSSEWPRIAADQEAWAGQVRLTSFKAGWLAGWLAGLLMCRHGQAAMRW